MAEPSSTSSSERGLKAWAIACVLVALVETSVALGVADRAPIDRGVRFYPPGRVPTAAESIIQWQITRSIPAEPSVELIVLGDSSALVGLIPRAIRRSTGLHTQNLGTFAPLFVEGHADVLERYLSDHPAPRAVVYQFSDASVANGLAEIERAGVLTKFRRWVGSDRPVVAWPSLRLRPVVEAQLGRSGYLTTDRDRDIRDFLTLQDGYLRDEPQGDIDWNRPRKRLPIAIHPDGLAGLGRLAAIAQRHGIHLFLMHTPLPAPHATPAMRAAQAANERLLRTHFRDAPQVTVVTPYLRELPARLFATGNHLRFPGAQQNSFFVADRIREYGIAKEPGE